MSENEKLDLNPHFFSLLTMFASACWQQLGKVPSQIDGKVHRDLAGAKLTIDMLLMLRDKTKGNLTKKEEEFLLSTISDLQLNYADELIKPVEKQSEELKLKSEDKTPEHKDNCECGCH